MDLLYKINPYKISHQKKNLTEHSFYKNCTSAIKAVEMQCYASLRHRKGMVGTCARSEYSGSHRYIDRDECAVNSTEINIERGF